MIGCPTALNTDHLFSPSQREGLNLYATTLCSNEMTRFMDEDNDVVLRSLTSIIEPVILILMGLVVGFVALSMFLPLFDLTAMAGGGG